MEKIQASKFATLYPNLWAIFIEKCEEIYEIECEECSEDIQDVNFSLSPVEFIDQLSNLDYPTNYTFYELQFKDENYVAIWCYSDNGRI